MVEHSGEEIVVNDKLTVLQIVRLRGRAAISDVAASAGSDIDGIVAQLRDEGLLEEARGRVKLTAEGRGELSELVARERDSVDTAAMSAAYERFHPINSAFKQVVTDWQLVDADTPNDHSDAAYDAQIVARLNDVHAQLGPLLADMAEVAPRLGIYPRRFGAAIDLINAGDHAWIARPLVDSYHTAWFELHEDLIGLCGLTREAEAAAGRAQ